MAIPTCQIAARIRQLRFFLFSYSKWPFDILLIGISHTLYPPMQMFCSLNGNQFHPTECGVCKPLMPIATKFAFVLPQNQPLIHATSIFLPVKPTSNPSHINHMRPIMGPLKPPLIWPHCCWSGTTAHSRKTNPSSAKTWALQPNA